MTGTAYLDHAASTPMRPEAVEAMEAAFRAGAANPTGAHKLAREARKVLDRSRTTIADAFGTDPGNVVFTGGGTEADNLAIFGVVGARGGLPACSSIEHHAVLHPVQHLGGHVFGVDARGVVDIADLNRVLGEIEATGEKVAVVSVMLANNESGVIQPLDDIAAVVRERSDAVLHTDAVQAVTWLDLKTHTAAFDLMSISAHKFGGPQGVGALVMRSDIDLVPVILGGGQERERRSGTQNVAGISAMAAAMAATEADRASLVSRIDALRTRLIDGLRSVLDGVHESGVDASGDRSHKVAGTAHLCFEGLDSESLLFLLERGGLYASAASSCASGAQEPSHVLAAMGVSRDLAVGSLRLSLGATTTDADIDLALSVIPAAVDQLRGTR